MNRCTIIGVLVATLVICFTIPSANAASTNRKLIVFEAAHLTENTDTENRAPVSLLEEQAQTQTQTQQTVTDAVAMRHEHLLHQAPVTAQLCNGIPCSELAARVQNRVGFDASSLYRADGGSSAGQMLTSSNDNSNNNNIPAPPASPAAPAAPASIPPVGLPATISAVNPYTIPRVSEVPQTSPLGRGLANNPKEMVDIRPTPLDRDPLEQFQETMDNELMFVKHLNNRKSVTGRLQHVDNNGSATVQRVDLVKLSTQTAAPLMGGGFEPEFKDDQGRVLRPVADAASLSLEAPKPSPFDQKPGDVIRWIPMDTMDRLVKEERKLQLERGETPFAHSNDGNIVNIQYGKFTRILPMYKDGPDFNLNNALNHPEKLINDLGDTASGDENIKRQIQEGREAYARAKAQFEAEHPEGQWAEIPDENTTADGTVLPKVVSDLPGASATESEWTGSSKLTTGFENWRAKNLEIRATLLDDYGRPLPQQKQTPLEQLSQVSDDSNSTNSNNTLTTTASVATLDTNTRARFRQVSANQAQQQVQQQVQQQQMTQEQLAQQALLEAHTAQLLGQLRELSQRRQLLHDSMKQTQHRLKQLHGEKKKAQQQQQQQQQQPTVALEIASELHKVDRRRTPTNAAAIDVEKRVLLAKLRQLHHRVKQNLLNGYN